MTAAAATSLAPAQTADLSRSDAGAFRHTAAASFAGDAQSLLELIFGSITHGILAVDRELRVIAFNRRYVEMFALPPGLVRIGLPYEDILRFNAMRHEHGDGDPEAHVRRRLERVRSLREPVRTEHDRPDGTIFSIRRAPLPDGGFINTYADITKRKNAEKALATKATELEAATAELRRSNAELEQFAYVASHDLQEPLRMVASYCQLLQRRYSGKLDKDADEFIGFAVEGAERMRQLVNDLLTYSRVGTKGKPFVEVAMEQVLDHALANLAVAIEEAGARVTHDRLPVVFGDPVQLGQLLQNLIGNAVKFRGDSPPEIHLGAGREDGRWLIWVRDNGIGIEPQYIDRIFLIFQRLHTRQQYPGTGIGLAVCKKIVERHDGRIWVESEPGRGSRFCFTLRGGQDRDG